MKKLLSILTISTLTASISAPLLANTILTRAKRDVSTLISNSNNDYLPIKQINGVNDKVQSIVVDSSNNIYFGSDKNAFVLKQGKSTPTKINGTSGQINYVSVDSNDNIYFGTRNGAYKLSAGSDTASKINGINYALAIAVDSSNNIYFGTDKGAFVLKHGSDTPIKINGIDKTVVSLTVDSKNNIYFSLFNDYVYKLLVGTQTPTKINGITFAAISLAVDSSNNIYFGSDKNSFVLKQGKSTPTKINGTSGQINSVSVDSNDNIYFGTSSGAYILQTALSLVKTQSKFALVDGTKTQTWIRPDLLSVDGELNIDITNPNIEKVVFDNVQQEQTNKCWTINVKPETAPRDHNLQVTFTLDGKQYTSEIMVSMQAKIDPIPKLVQQNLSDLIKTTDLGNIIDSNDNTIFTAVNQKNGNFIDDFSQIEITKKDNHSATLKSRDDSKSYKCSVDVKYNVVPATVVDLKIDVIPTSSTATVIKDYLGQIDNSKMTNPVNRFYYANSENVITMVKPTSSSVITGVVYGCDEQWNKTSQSSNIDPSKGIKFIDGSQQLATKEGKYAIELSDNLGHNNNVYLQIAKDKKIPNYFDTDNGKQFEIWAKANGYHNIRGSSASQLNKLFEESKNWQKLASDSQFASGVADWFKINGKLSSTEPLTKEQVIEQLKLQIPSDIIIAGIYRGNFDINKVSFELNQSEFNPNDKVNIVVKYNNATAEQFTLQIKNSNAPNNKKKDLSSSLGIWSIFGIVFGSLAGLALLGWLLKKFVVDPFILKPIRKKKEKAFAAKAEKDMEQYRKDEAEWKAKQKGDK